MIKRIVVLLWVTKKNIGKATSLFQIPTKFVSKTIIPDNILDLNESDHTKV